MSVRVVIVPGGIGGTGGLSIDARNLANGLAGRGYEVVVAAGDPSDPALRGLEGTYVVELRRRGPSGLGSTFGLYTGIGRVMRSRRDAIVHVFGCMPSHLTWSALAAARAGGNPLVWTPMFHPLRSRVWRRRLALRPMLVFDRLAPRAARLADVIGVATDAEAAVFREAGARRVELLPPVVEPVAVCSETRARAFRAAIGVGAAPLVAVVASRDEPRKGLGFAWASFERLRLELPGARLVLVGLADTQQPLPDGALSLGRVDEETLRCALRAADLVFVPSLFEAFSRVVIEAWQQETTVVVTDGVALAPLLEEAGGAVVPYGEAGAAAAGLRAMLADRNRAAASGRAGRRLVEERFALDALLDRIEPLYRTLQAGARTAARAARPARAA
jgi:glycosyltransferase involved in cell wall biosynthesis